jgi:nucleoside-diphosphate-sugar epimerase
MNRLCVVTGASGFIGQYVVHRLLERRARVRVLVRDPEKLPASIRQHVEIVRGDIRLPAMVAKALCDAHVVIHLAACAKAWSRDPLEFHDVNVRAMGTLLEEAQRQAVDRLVHVSTILTLPAYRTAPINGRAMLPTPYEATKAAGERLVEAYAATGRHAVIVHPTRVYGPGPLHDANGVTKAIALYLRGRLRFRLADGDALGSYVHVDDVAEGIIRAAVRGRPGAHYVLGGENTSFRELLALVSQVTGVRRRVLTIPPRVGLVAARATQVWGMFGGQVPITPGWVRVLLEDRRATIEQAHADLGYTPRSLEAGMTETLSWLAAGGRVRSRAS